MIDGGLRQLFRAHLPAVFFQSVETGGTGRGIPDTHYIIPPAGISGWIEYKETSTWSVPLDAEQVAWIGRYIRYGGRAFVAVRRRHAGGPRKGPAVDELYLFWGHYAPQIKAEGIRPQKYRHLHRYVGGPSIWPWPEILARLAGQ